MVLGFPANDFGGQEPGSNKEIAKFCQVNYDVTFPVFAKTSVVGANANPLYRALAAQTGKPPRWNFHKYLLDRAAQPTGWETIFSYKAEVGRFQWTAATFLMP